MQSLLSNIKACTICKDHLPLEPNPVVTAHPNSRIAIIGQAPGTKVHNSGIPWDDASGSQLRKWMGIDVDEFYDVQQIAIIPMGFCYPGKGKSGDLPPRPECAPKWHDLLWKKLDNIELTFLIGKYAQQYYLGNKAKKNLTETVRSYSDYLPQFFPLPHPSPRNRFWLAKNPWFLQDVIPELQMQVKAIIE